VLSTTVVGSYPQPAWLVDHELLRASNVPRIRRREIWRIPDEHLGAAQDDATLLAIRDMERAGVDTITDGEIRRESYSNRFATALDGIDAEHDATIVNRAGREARVPRVVGPVRRARPVEVDDMAFLRANSHARPKITLPGPFTMAQQAVDEHYGDFDALVMDLAAAVNAEARDLVAAGADVIQLDEPWVRNDPERARRIAVAAIDRALEGLDAETAVHVCFGYAAMVDPDKPTGYAFLGELSDSIADQISIESAQPDLDLGILRELAPKTVVLGVLDLSDPAPETADVVADRLRAALSYLPPDRLVAARLGKDVEFAVLAQTLRRVGAGIP
jgi:5-methyltetrahydropteroyltriglutamate--homocysteine methyltransferase